MTNNYYFVNSAGWCRALFRMIFHLWRQLTRIHELLLLNVDSGLKKNKVWCGRSRRLWGLSGVSGSVPIGSYGVPGLCGVTGVSWDILVTLRADAEASPYLPRAHQGTDGK